MSKSSIAVPQQNVHRVVTVSNTVDVNQVEFSVVVNIARGDAQGIRTGRNKRRIFESLRGERADCSGQEAAANNPPETQPRKDSHSAGPPGDSRYNEGNY